MIHQNNTSLVIIRQNSLSTEKFSKNSIQKNVHVVVKNTTFIVEIGLKKKNETSLPKLIKEAPFDFHQITVEATLLYDCDEGKQVDFVKLKPLEYKAHQNETGDLCIVELRVKVLTSQLEDMFFRIKFQGVDCLTKLPYPSLVVMSEPIKVISKPDQIKKKVSKSKKRSITDLFLEALNRNEIRQNEQHKLLLKLYSKSEARASSSSSTSTTQQYLEKFPTETTSSLKFIESNLPLLLANNNSNNEFECSFVAFLNSFNNLKDDVKPAKIRKLIDSIPSREEVEQLTELLDICWTEGLQKEMRRDNLHNNDECEAKGLEGILPCDIDNCTYKKELERIDEFYKDFLSTTYLSMNV